jgi:hypothetical protein
MIRVRVPLSRDEVDGTATRGVATEGLRGRAAAREKQFERGFHLRAKPEKALATSQGDFLHALRQVHCAEKTDGITHGQARHRMREEGKACADGLSRHSRVRAAKFCNPLVEPAVREEVLNSQSHYAVSTADHA